MVEENKALAALRSLNFNAVGVETLVKEEVADMPCCDCVRRISSGMCPDLEEVDSKGKTVLQYASFMGHQACMHELIEAGANVNAQTSATGCTPLHFASMCLFSSSLSCTALLRDAGADPKITNISGMTCLDCAKDPEHRSKLQQLLGITEHQYRGRKTKREKEINDESDSESPVTEEEEHFGYWDDDATDSSGEESESESEEEEEEEEEEEGAAAEEDEHAAYTVKFGPREIDICDAQVQISNSSPGTPGMAQNLRPFLV